MESHRLPTALFVGPVPPPVFGQAVGMQILLDSAELRSQYRLLHVNTNNIGKNRIRRVVSTIGSLSRYIGRLVAGRPEVVYLSITRSTLGCVKDCIIVALARLYRTPVVVHLRGGDMAVFYRALGPLWRRWVSWAYQRITLGIVLGESLRPQFEGLLPPQKVRVVFNCWSDGESCVFSRRPERSGNEPLRISFISNVLPSKGLYDTLEGVAWAIRHGVQVDFQFAGAFLGYDGALAKLPELAHENLPAAALEENFERLVKTLGIERCVRRLGTITGAEKWDLLAQTDILLLPIYNPTEGQPLVAIEAMRAGCALISTQCGGLVDIVEDDVTGRVVRPRAPQEIGEAIQWFWEKPHELTRISQANMDRAQRLHDPQKHIREIIGVFEEARLSPRNGHKTLRCGVAHPTCDVAEPVSERGRSDRYANARP